jgi:hypothetical protein
MLYPLSLTIGQSLFGNCLRPRFRCVCAFPQIAIEQWSMTIGKAFNHLVALLAIPRILL